MKYVRRFYVKTKIEYVYGDNQESLIFDNNQIPFRNEWIGSFRQTFIASNV